MATNFRKLLPDLKRNKLSCLILLFLALSSCKRIVHEDKDSIPYLEKEAVTDAEFQKVMHLKLPLKTISVKQYELNIPQNTDFDTMRVFTKDLTEGYEKMGKIDLTKLSGGYMHLTLNNIFTKGTQMYSQGISIIPENDASLLTIKDMKADMAEGFEYYSDENSLIFEHDDSFTAVHFDYDTAHKSYLVYQAEMSWSQKFAKKEKLDLFLHLIKNAKSMMTKNPAPVTFNSWEEYVQNSPVIETNILKNIFKKAAKEVKVFLEENDETTIGIDNSNGLIKLYRPTTPNQLDFYKFIDAVKANQLGSLETAGHKAVFDFSTANSYKVRQEGSSYVIEASATDYGGQVRTAYTVVCPISYKGKDVFVSTESSWLADDVNLFVKMFNYFGKKYTLATN